MSTSYSSLSTSEDSEDSSEMDFEENIVPFVNPLTAEIVDYHDENDLAQNFKKLLKEVPDLFCIVPVTDEFWYSNLEDTAYLDTSFFISKKFSTAFLNKSPLLENSLCHQFRKLFPHLGDFQLLTIVGYGCWNLQRLQYWLYQLKQWRDRELNRNLMRAVLVRQDEEKSMDPLDDKKMEKLDEKKRMTMEKQKGSLDKKVRRMIESFFEETDTIEENEQNAEDECYQKLGYGDKEQMLKAAREWHDNLKAEVLQLQLDIRHLKNPPEISNGKIEEFNKQIREQEKESQHLEEEEKKSRQRAHIIKMTEKNYEQRRKRAIAIFKNNEEFCYKTVRNVEENYRKDQVQHLKRVNDEIPHLKRRLAELSIIDAENDYLFNQFNN